MNMPNPSNLEHSLYQRDFTEIDAIYAGMEDVSIEAGNPTAALAALATAEAAQNTTADLSLENDDFSREVLQPQLLAALKAYDTIAESFSAAQYPISPEQFSTELDKWLTDDRLDYARQKMEQDPELRFTLVATPNVLPKDHEEVFAAAKGFGSATPGSPQAHNTWIYDKEMSGDLYGKYSLEQLAGNDPTSDSAIQFSLMPSKSTEELSNMTAKQQRQILQNDLQPSMNRLKVPSVLEAITYWHILSNQLPKHNGDSQQLADFGLTYIRHFDLPDQSVDGYSLVPGSCVLDDGRPSLGGSDADFANGARLSVG